MLQPLKVFVATTQPLNYGDWIDSIISLHNLESIIPFFIIESLWITKSFKLFEGIIHARILLKLSGVREW